MPNVSIIVNQVGISPGEAGVSRDDLLSGSLVTLTNDAPGNVGAETWRWEFISWPKMTPTQAAPTLTGALTQSCTFTPIVIGTYILQLTINGAIRGRIGAAIKTVNLNIRLPGELESAEYVGGWEFNLVNFLRVVEINAGGSGATTLCNLTDVDCSSVASGNCLVYNEFSGYWEAGVIPTSICNLNDVVCGEPVSGNVLTYTSEGGYWYPNSMTVCSLSDVTCGEGPSNGDVLMYVSEGGFWYPTSVPGGSVCALSDVSCGEGPNDGDVLIYGSGTWTPGPMSAGALCSLSDVNCNHFGDVAVGDSLVAYDDSGIYWGAKPLSDRILIFSDDTEFTETTTSYVTKKTFRVVIDSDKPFAYWRVVFSLWSTGASNAMSCYVNIGGDSYEWSALTDASETIYSITFQASTFYDLPLTAIIQIKSDDGVSVAHIKYTDIYGIYDKIAPV